jgi:hypothetical protein
LTAHTGDHLLAGHDCDGASSDDPGVLSVVALALVLPPSTVMPSPVEACSAPAVLTRSGRAVEVDRPPP